MALVRRSLNSDVADVVESAQDLVDWKGYVRRYPMALLGAAAAVGFVLVPGKAQVIKPSVDDVAHLIRNKQIVVSNRAAKPGIISTLVTLVATTALRSVLTNVGAKANHFVANAQANRHSRRKDDIYDEVQDDQRC